jgi:hypothetical protein
VDEDKLERERVRVNQLGQSRGFGDAEYIEAVDLLTTQERQFAQERGLPYARPIDLGAIWEPNEPDPQWWETGHSAYLSLLPTSMIRIKATSSSSGLGGTDSRSWRGSIQGSDTLYGNGACDRAFGGRRSSAPEANHRKDDVSCFTLAPIDSLKSQPRAGLSHEASIDREASVATR